MGSQYFYRQYQALCSVGGFKDSVATVVIDIASRCNANTTDHRCQLARYNLRSD